MSDFTIKQPISMVVPINNVKDYIRVSGDDSDNMIKDIIISVERQIIDITKIVPSVTDVVVRIFPEESSVVKIPFSPIIAVTQVKNGESTLGLDEYSLQNKVLSIFPNSKRLKIVATISCGHVDLSDLPSDIKLAILMQTAYVYDNRDGSKVGIMPAMADLLSKFRVFKF
ncbi:MAG: phage gp6-like head-tail connector protein [Alphaproteobacteria bacterium]|nr:phage gp6-like head-tail connector protein [Rickettsiales bacterium]